MSAYRLEPETRGGIYNMNGEYVDYGPIQAGILPRCCYVFSTLDKGLPVARRIEEEKSEETSVVAVEGATEEEEKEDKNSAPVTATLVQQ